MKVTKQYLKQLILEELQEQEQQPAGQQPAADEASLQSLKKQLQGLVTNLSGIQTNELEIVKFLISLIKLAKAENINVGELKRKLGFVKDAAEKIAK